MAPKKNAREPAPSAAATTQAGTTGAGVVPVQPKPSVISKAVAEKESWGALPGKVYEYYVKETPQRTMLIDVFLVFIVAVGALQFAYCILAGNYPFNAFLSGFSSCVGQFVLTMSLRTQTSKASKTDFPEVSPERAFADYIVCSLILHFFCINFIN